MSLIKTHVPRRSFLRGVGATVALPFLDPTPPARPPLAQTSAAPNWRLKASVAESCSCDIPCPCNFGFNPTRMPCNGNRVYSIQSGHSGDVDVSGVAFLVTFTMRGWSKIYVSDRATDRQVAAVKGLLPLAFAGFYSGMESFTRAPLTMEITEKRVTYSVPESSVDMELMGGFDGKPVKILNLPNPTYQNYTQYRSVVLRHESADHRFNYSGTNGFTSTMEVGSKS